ncbi:MAG: benzoate 1,2-dioxygenase small subunit [Halioglobus sp.]
MTGPAIATSPEEQRALERFYYFEARLLDSRQYQDWLALLTEDVRYSMPSRVNVQVDNRERGTQQMLSVARELEGPEGSGNPLRDESYVHLMLRVERAFKINSWSENPPARTRRMVGNVELMARREGELDVLSNFQLFYARPGTRDVIYSGQRSDTLRVAEDSYRIASREVVLDYAEIEKPSLGLLF